MVLTRGERAILIVKGISGFPLARVSLMVDPILTFSYMEGEVDISMSILMTRVRRREI